MAPIGFLLKSRHYGDHNPAWESQELFHMFSSIVSSHTLKRCEALLKGFMLFRTLLRSFAYGLV